MYNVRHVIPELKFFVQGDGETLTAFEDRLRVFVREIAALEETSARPTLLPFMSHTSRLHCLVSWASKKPHRGPRAVTT